MARIRTIKPSFFMSRRVKQLTDKQKLVWLGLWPNADDHGRLLDEPGILAGQLWALGMSEKQLDRTLGELHEAGRLIRYVVAGDSYLQVTNWEEHQKINRPTDSLIPPVPRTARSVSPHGANTEPSLLEGKGEERKGGEEPSRYCADHPTGTRANCGPCGDARKDQEAWLRAQKNKPTPSPPKTCKHRYVQGWCANCSEPDPATKGKN